MLRYVREKDVALFVELAKEPRPKNPSDLSLRVIVPAYITSELSSRVSDRGRVVSALPCDRHGSGIDHYIDWNDAASSGCDFNSVEAIDFCHG